MGIDESLDSWEKNYLSSFCLEECWESCCNRKKTKVLMDESQVREAYQLSLNDIITNTDHRIFAGMQNGSTNLYWVSTHPAKEHPHCPAYEPKTRKCKIEHNKPAMCKAYPLDVKSHFIILSSKCTITKKDTAPMQRLTELARQYSLGISFSSR